MRRSDLNVHGMTALIVIPARMASQRLPGKPLADIHGRPMVAWVWEQAMAAEIGPVVVAAGDAEIVKAVQAAGGSALATDPDLPSGSDRVWAAAQMLDPNGGHDIIVNLQGDMPTLPARAIRDLVAVLQNDPAAQIATLAAEVNDEDQRNDPNVVKVIPALATGARSGKALYFTRAPAPSGPGPIWHHVGVYAFRRVALERFTALPPSPLERRERLEQLRAIEAGMAISVTLIEEAPDGVDTPADLERVREIIGTTL